MSDHPEPVTLDLLGLLLRDVQTEQRELRTAQREQLKLLLGLVEQGRRTDRHVTELRDDLELMLRAEMMGSLGHLRNGIERELSALTERVEALEGRAPRI